MNKTYLWDRSHRLPIETGPDIVGGFSIGFDDGIPEETKDLLMHYVHWVDDHYHLPVTLWNEMVEGYEPDEATVEAIMQAYQAYCKETGHTF